MSTPLETFIGYFYLVPRAIKNMTTGEMSKDYPIEESKIFEDYINNTVKGGTQTQRIINYLNEQIRLTPAENQELYVNDLVLEFKKIEDTLFANWNNEGIWVINDETIRQNFDLSSHCQEPTTLQQKYILNCLWLFCEFFIEFKKLCAKYKVDIGRVLNNFNFVLIDNPNDIDKLEANDVDNPLIFDIELLNKVHSAFDGFLWDSVGNSVFGNWFRKNPIGKITLQKNMTLNELCYTIGKFEDDYNRGIITNFSKWMVYHVGGDDKKYLKLKAILTKRETENIEKEKIHHIKTRKSLKNKAMIDKKYSLMLPI